MQMDCHTWLKQLSIVFCLACFGVYAVESDSTENELRDYLKHFNKNRHHVTNPDGKTHTRDFIRNTFISFGLHTWMESFYPSPPITKVAKGENIIGFLPGKLARTRDDRLILIGSHYDTMRSTSHGADDNGSGVVALLRVAKLLAAKRGSSREYSVMFVAFDFEERENNTLQGCACAQIGCGSRVFVSNFSRYYNLLPNMSVARYGQLQGAIIMDTMMNYNSAPNSQDVPQQLQGIFPKQYDSIIGNEKRGDFLLVTGRSTDDMSLMNTFKYYYRVQAQDYKYKLQYFPLPFDGPAKRLPQETKYELRFFLRSDHVSFWNEMTSNRAIFLSDTANMRSYMITCYHKDCDDMSHVTDDFLGFLSKSCDAIVMTTNYLMITKCKMGKYSAQEADLTAAEGGGIGVAATVVAAVSALVAWIFCRRRTKDDDSVLVENDQMEEGGKTDVTFQSEAAPQDQSPEA